MNMMFSTVRVLQSSILPSRAFSTTNARSAIDISKLVRKSASKVQENEEVRKAKDLEEKERSAILVKGAKGRKKIFSANLFNDMYRSEFRKPPTLAETTNLNHFFYSSRIQLDWMTYKYIEMLGELKRSQTEQKKMKEMEENERKLSDLNDIVEFEDDKVELNAEKTATKNEKTGFVKPNITPGLPEVIFLGKCNVGKSTLLNALVSPSNHKKLREYAFSSKVAGYTQTMNAFNLGNRLRIIDTPGYGVKGRPAQGRQVLGYLKNRKELRKCYLLIAAHAGFNEHDFQVLDMLNECGVPYEIVITKVDKLKSESIVKRNIKTSGILAGPVKPNIIFTSSFTNRQVATRQGFVELRKSIFESCGYKPDLKPVRRR